MDAKKLVSNCSIGDPVDTIRERGTSEAFLQMSLYTEAVMEIEKVHPEYDGKYLELEVFPYMDRDSDDMMKLAVLVSFIQHHEIHDESLDTKVLEKIVKIVSDFNFPHVVNDINVNGLQWRDGVVKTFVMD